MDLLKDEAARSVGKALGFAPLVGIAGLLFGLSITTHRTPVIVASGIAIVVPLIAALILGRDPSPAKPQAAAATPVAKDPSTVPAVAAVAPVESEPAKTGATGAKAVETTVVPSGGNGGQAEASAEPENGKVKSDPSKPELKKPKKSKKEKKAKKSKKKK